MRLLPIAAVCALAAIGARPALAATGVTVSAQEISEVMGNVSGGVHQGATYDGLTTITLAIDTGKALGWDGGTFNISALQIHGRSLSDANLDNLQTVSGIEASRATRLWELWYQQSFAGGGADVKIGQQSIDQEFMVSQYSGLYLNTMMGWPILPSADLYSGFPAYPLSSLGARLREKPAGPLSVLAGVFDDNPPGGPFGDDSQRRGREASGTRFNLGTGALFIAEIQYAVGQPAGTAAGSAARDRGLPGTYKLGAWYDTAAFQDQRFDTAGASLASPTSSGVARTHRGNFSIYGVVDQELWHDRQGPRSLGVFARVMVAPADRNLIDFSVNAGINLKSPLPGRNDDAFGLGYGYAHISRRASDLDRDTGLFSGTAYPIRRAEHFVELTYQYQVTSSWQLQPDFQYVIDPGGRIPNPRTPSQRLGNEAVFGLRTTLAF
jgi:porin